MRTLFAAAAIAAIALSVPLGASAKHKPGHQPGTGNLSIKASPNPVLIGRQTTFTGKLTGGDNAGKTIELQHDPWPYGTTYESLTSTATNSKGEYTVTAMPDRNTNFRTVAALTPEARSDNVLVLVRVRITYRVSDTTPARGQLVTIAGNVRPAHNGRRVLIQRRRASGSWRTVAKPKLHAAPYGVEGASEYSRALRINRNGVYRVRIKSHADHVGNKTKRFRLVVH